MNVRLATGRLLDCGQEVNSNSRCAFTKLKANAVKATQAGRYKSNTLKPYESVD